MTMLDKLKFWKKKDDFPDLKLGLDLGKGVGGFGKDVTSGLGGTGDLGFRPETDISLRGPGAETVMEESKLTPSPLGTSSFGGFSQPSPKADIMAKDIEIISSKLDALRAQMEAVNQRLANIEAYMNDQKRRGW